MPGQPVTQRYPGGVSKQLYDSTTGATGGFNQYAGGHIHKQLAALSGYTGTFNQYATGGPTNQLIVGPPAINVVTGPTGP